MAKYVVESGSSSSGVTSKRPYDAMVYKDTASGYTIAVDGDGNVIKKVLSSLNNDDVVIQAALDVGGRVVLNPNSTYYVKSTLIIGTTNTTLESYQSGFYDTSTARLMASMGIVDSVIRADGCNNTSIIGCNISGNSMAGVSGITFDQVSFGLISRCQFNSINKNAIEFVGAQSNIITIERCYGTNISGSFIYDYGWLTDSRIINNDINGGVGIRLRAGNNHIAFNNIFLCTDYGIIFDAGGNYQYVGYNRINQCAVGISITSGTRHIICSNHIYGSTSVTTAALYIGSGAHYVCNNMIRGNAYHGITNLTNGSLVVGNYIGSNGGYGIDHYDGDDCIYVGNRISTSTLSNMRVRSAYRLTIMGNNIDSSAAYGISATSCTDCNLNGNTFYNNTSGPVSGSFTTSIIKNNIGYTTESTGTAATITAGNTYVDVTHSLAATPTKVRVTPTTNLGTRSFWVDTKEATTFRININSSDIIDHTFDWEAEV